MKIKNIVLMIKFVVMSEFAGLIGSIFTAPAIDGWYASLEKPLFNPPNWVFGPVWTTLFLLIGVAVYWIYINTDATSIKKRIAFIVFGIQFILNIIWSLLFFKLQSPFLAFVEVIILWIFILLTIILFYKISKKAGIILLPYILWVSLAAYLNWQLWLLN
ncbi:MAG: TspO/MBR family protein [Minisyncoccia bacterium]